MCFIAIVIIFYIKFIFQFRNAGNLIDEEPADYIAKVLPELLKDPTKKFVVQRSECDFHLEGLQPANAEPRIYVMDSKTELPDNSVQNFVESMRDRSPYTDHDPKADTFLTDVMDARVNDPLEKPYLRDQENIFGYDQLNFHENGVLHFVDCLVEALQSSHPGEHDNFYIKINKSHFR